MRVELQTKMRRGICLRVSSIKSNCLINKLTHVDNDDDDVGQELGQHATI